LEAEVIYLFAVGWFLTALCFLLVYYVISRFERESLKYYENSLLVLKSIHDKLEGGEHPAVRAISDAAMLITEAAKRLEALRKSLTA
jgi:hypothetical protein